MSKEAKMKQVVIEYAERWTSGGIESYILNMVKHLDKELFDIRIVVAQKETDIYDDELSVYGVTVESLLPEIYTNPIRRVIANQKVFKSYLQKIKCDVIHLHICQGVAMRYAKLAKTMGVSKVISHSHNTKIGDGHQLLKRLGHELGKIKYSKYVDKMVACSDLAAEWLYTKKNIREGKVDIVKYIVDVDAFTFSNEERKNYRSRYGLSNDIKVYLNIGRLHYQKNQLFLLDVFREICIQDEKCRLVIIGDGELRKQIHQHAKKLGMYEKIIFVENTRAVSKYMSMSDIFVLPSLYEGNPIVGIEAQASGLICVFSDTITKQAKVLASTRFISLKKTPAEWANKILVWSKKCVGYSRDSNQLMKNEGYDIMKQILHIESIYLN